MGKKEKVLLILLIVGALGGVIYYYGHRQMQSEIAALTAQRNVLRGQSDQYIAIMASLSAAQAQIPLVEQAIETIAGMHTSPMPQSYYFLLLEELLVTSNIVLSTIAYRPSRALPFVNDYLRRAALYGMEVAMIGYNSYQLEFDTTKDDLITFLQLIENSDGAFVSSNILFFPISDDRNEDEYEQEEMLRIRMELRFFHVANLDDLTFDYNFDEIFYNTVFDDDRTNAFRFDS